MKIRIGNYPTHRFWHNWIGWEKKEKIRVRIDPWDTWSMDHTLAHIVVPMLEQLRATTHGAPLVDEADRPEHLIGTVVDRRSGAVDEYHFDAWDWILGEMLFAHQSKLEEWEQQFFSGVHDTTWVELPSGHKEMKKGPNDTFKIDWDGRKAYQARITNGFRLFGKYYENLWD